MSEEIKITKEDVANEEIPATDSAPAGENAKPGVDLAAEFREFGRQIADTFRTAWDSAERQKLEAELREGAQSFAAEFDKVIRELREGSTGQKIKEEASELKAQMESGEFRRKARASVVQGLRWLSEELGKVADQFNPAAKEPEAEEPDEIKVEETPPQAK